jgi:hypothetical protein
MRANHERNAMAQTCAAQESTIELEYGVAFDVLHECRWTGLMLEGSRQATLVAWGSGAKMPHVP